MNTSVKYQVMPPLSPDEYQELQDDIAQRGVIEPIHVDDDGVVIDGHHRKRIADELGIECPSIVHADLDDAGKRSLAFTLNLKRRHLNREQRRALIAESLKADPGLSNREHARRTGVDHKTVQAVRYDAESNGEIPHYEPGERKEASGRVARGAAQSEPKQPVPELSGNPAQLPTATALSQHDLDELNAEPPTWQPAGHMRDTDLNDMLKTRATDRRPPLLNDLPKAVHTTTKAIEQWERITNDDRFNANKNQIRETYLSDLVRARDAISKLIQSIAL